MLKIVAPTWTHVSSCGGGICTYLLGCTFMPLVATLVGEDVLDIC